MSDQPYDHFAGYASNAEAQMPGRRQELPIKVGQLNWFVKNLLENSVPRIWVEGEVSDLSQPSSGHLYFSLKDENSQIRAVIWRSNAERLPFKLKDGLSVVCQGNIEVYQPRGSYQLIVNQLQPKGVGPLQLAFQQLKQQLTKEGLFDPSHKKPIPQFPKRVGFVTSLSGAALHDFLEASRGRWANYELTIFPARMQGESARMEIVQALRQAHRIRPKFDLLLVGRGGGSVEDLWCFNDEQVVRAISKCRIPVVSAIGHEVDVTLSDMVADARALTPTDAARIVFPSRQELFERTKHLMQRASSVMRSRTQAVRARLNSLRSRGILSRPHTLHIQRREEIDDIELRCRSAAWRLIEQRKQSLATLARATEALSPLQVLGRGYSLTQMQDAVGPLISSEDVKIGDTIHTTLKDGRLESTVTRSERQ